MSKPKNSFFFKAEQNGFHFSFVIKSDDKPTTYFSQDPWDLFVIPPKINQMIIEKERKCT